MPSTRQHSNAIPSDWLSPEATANLIMEELRGLAEPARALGAQRFSREPITALGVAANATMIERISIRQEL